MPPDAPPPESLAPAEVIAYVLAALAIILIAARIVGGLFAKLGQPRIVGEIIAGILIGPTVLGGSLARGGVTALDRPAVDGTGLVNDLYPLQSFAFLNLIGVLTLVFFMFLVGLEVEQRFLRGREKQILVVSGAVIVAPVGLGFLVGAILNTPTWMVEMTPDGLPVSSTTHALFIGTGIAVTAFPVMARILQEKRMLATPMGGVGVGAAALVTPLMFLLLAGATASARGQGVPDTIAIKLLLAIALAIFLFVAVRPGLGWVIRRRFDPDKPLDGDLLALLLIGAVLSALAADRIGIHALNGGFLFGACVPQVPGLGKAVIDRMGQFVVTFMIPIFLAVAGIQTNLRDLELVMIPGIALFLAAMIIGKWVAGALAGRAVGLQWNEANAIGVLMNCRGLMILVVALIGLQAGVITPALQIAFVLGAIITTLMTGPLVDVFLPAQQVEEERDRSMTKVTATLAAMTGGRRVLLAPSDQAAVGPSIDAAREYLGSEPAPQFLVAGMPPLSENSDYVGAGPTDEETSIAGTLRWLRPVATALRAAGADADAAAVQSPDPPADLVALANSWPASDAIVSSPEAADALSAAGIEVKRI